MCVLANVAESVKKKERSRSRPACDPKIELTSTTSQLWLLSIVYREDLIVIIRVLYIEIISHVAHSNFQVVKYRWLTCFMIIDEGLYELI